jgi:hypothetical protein
MGGEDSGITVSVRQSFTKTLSDKESVIMSVPVLVAWLAALLKNVANPVYVLGASLVGTLIFVLVATLLRHQTSPAFTWAIERLKD